MPFFNSKPKNGPGFVRITYCGFVKAPGGGQTAGLTSKTFSQVTDSNSAQNFILNKLNSNSIIDSFGNIIGRNTNYNLGQYNGYNESKSQPGKFYHDFTLVSPEDSFCHTGGIKKRNSRKRRITKRRSIRRRHNKTKSRR